MRISLSPCLLRFHTPRFFYTFIMSEAFGIGTWLLALRLRHAFTSFIRSQLRWHFHSMKREFCKHIFLARDTAASGLQSATLWLRIDDYRL